METRMRRWIVFASLSILGSGWLLPHTATAQPELDYWQVLSLDRTAFRFKNVALLPLDSDPGQRMVYGDRYGVVRVSQVTGDDVQEIWRSRTLGGGVLEVMVDDLGGNGGVEIIVRTDQGRIYVFDETYNQRWETPQNEYGFVASMAIANMDDDPAYELVLLADELIHYIDGESFARELRSTQSFRASEIAVGNVDTDFNLEIVLNTGFVLDATRLEPDWSTEIFGQFVELLDIDGDGIQEVLGYTPEQAMRIFDVDDQQEKPLR